MTKKNTVFVITALMGLMSWSGRNVSAQDQMATMDASGYLRRGVPGGYKLKKIDGNATDNQDKIKKIMNDEAMQLKAVSQEMTLTKEQKMEKTRQITEASQAEIKALLTPERLKKYEEACQKKQVIRDKLRQRKMQKTSQVLQTQR